jgi:hypothetical protein
MCRKRRKAKSYCVKVLPEKVFCGSKMGHYREWEK